MGRMTNQNLSRAEAAARSAALQVDSYEVSLDLRNAEDQGEPGFLSKTVITFSCSDPGSTVFVDFIHGGVHSVLLNGRPLDPAEVVDGSRTLVPGLEAQNQAIITLKLTNAGTSPHGFEIACVQTPNDDGCQTEWCFPAESEIAPIDPGETATAVFKVPLYEGEYPITTGVEGDKAAAQFNVE